MPLKPQLWARLVTCGGVALAVSMFGSGRLVSAFEQTPPQVPASTSQPQPTAATGPVLQLSADEAVRMALENNLGIQAERLGPEIGTLGIAEAKAAYALTLISTTTSRSSTQPPSSFLTGSASIITDESFRTNAGLAQNVPWGGGRYQFTLDGSRITTNGFTSYNPQLGSNMAMSYVQPLLRGFRIDSLRQQLLTSRNNQTIADVQLREQITVTSQAVRNTYFDLLGAIEGHKVARQSLDLSLESLKNNRTRVEVGTMAPIDIIEAEAEVASNEEAVINAEARIRTFEDRLRALVLNPQQADFWAVRIEPSEVPTATPVALDVDAAVRNALANRTDLARLRKQIDNVDVGLKFAQDQKLPALDLVANYNTVGLAGTQFRFGQGGFPPPIESQSQRNFAEALRDVFGQDFRTWSLQLQFSYPLGTSAADANAAAGRLQKQQGTAGLRDMEVQVATAVRDAARQVETNMKRVDATRKARDFAERRLEAEQKRMTVGLSTTFQLFQAQRDLARQRQQEVNAMIDYNRSVVTFEAVQTAPVR
jgi:outer membrane protein TolC